MDPEEGGGTPPPRCSRRLQHLDPPSLVPPNDNQNPTAVAIHPEDASASQYGSRYLIPPMNDTPVVAFDDVSTLPSIHHERHQQAIIPAFSTHGSVLHPTPPIQQSNDPPEECFVAEETSQRTSSASFFSSIPSITF